MKNKHTGPFKRCQKTQRIVGFNFEPWYMKSLLPVLGIASIIWILVRVIPKPSRASYPCMQVAAPLAASFFGYLGVAGLLAVTVRWIKSLEKYKQRIVIGTCSLFAIMALCIRPGIAAISVASENAPIGVARGTVPGRVVWVHDPEAVDHTMSSENWYTDAFNNQPVINSMVAKSVLALTEAETEVDAWNEIFNNFNERRHNDRRGYASGEKIAIKINQNEASNSRASNKFNASPHMAFALVKSLVDGGGIPEGQITVYDASRFMALDIVTKVKAVYPGVTFKEHSTAGSALAPHPDIETVEYFENQIVFSDAAVNADPKAHHGLPRCVVEADYLINMALLKGHNYLPTLCGKNWFGSTSISRNALNNTHLGFFAWWGRSGVQNDYITFVDFMGHKDMGEKTMLFMIDGLTGSYLNGNYPNTKFQNPPFNNQWASSLLVSQDMVAIDSVGADFVMNDFDWDQFNDNHDSYYRRYDTYLREASLADNPASGVFYDPESDGTRMNSLGVFERWNNVYDREYTGNMGIAGGIQLFKVYKNPVEANADGSISIGAEFYHKNTPRGIYEWTEVSIPGSATVMQSPQDTYVNFDANYLTDSPRLDYGVHFPAAGVYNVWVRGMAQAGKVDASDTCHVGLDYLPGENAAGTEDTSDRINGFAETLNWRHGTMDGASAQLYVPNAGYHVVNLWMCEAGFSADHIVLIPAVTEPTQSIEFTNLSNGDPVTFGEDLIIEPTITGFNAEDIALVYLQVDGGVYSTDFDAPYTLDGSGLGLGSHTLYLWLKDSSGTWTGSEPVNITVVEAGKSVAFTNLSNGDPIPFGADLTITPTITGYSPEEIALVYLQVDGGVYSTDFDAPYSLSGSGLSLGSHTLVLWLKESSGTWKGSEVIEVTVSP